MCLSPLTDLKSRELVFSRVKGYDLLFVLGYNVNISGLTSSLNWLDYVAESSSRLILTIGLSHSMPARLLKAGGSFKRAFTCDWSFISKLPLCRLYHKFRRGLVFEINEATVFYAFDSKGGYSQSLRHRVLECLHLITSSIPV